MNVQQAPKFSKRDFEFIADLLRMLSISEDEAELVADELAATNPLFKRSTFLARVIPEEWADEDIDPDDALWDADDMPTDELVEELATVIPFKPREGSGMDAFVNGGVLMLDEVDFRPEEKQ